MLILTILALGLIVGLLVGLLGIGGGVVLVPAMVYLLHYDQHLAQGTSLFILLPPIGLGALRGYWKNGEVDLRAGIYCAIGFLLGGYVGGKIAVLMQSRYLKGTFGFFLMLSAVLLWRKSSSNPKPEKASSQPVDSGCPACAPAASAIHAPGLCGSHVYSWGLAGFYCLALLTHT
jgi:uncharacterized protein